MLEFPTTMSTSSNALSTVEVITITMQLHFNDLLPTFAEPNSTMKNCHPSPNWKVIYSTLMNHADSPNLRKIDATSTNMLTLPANSFITTQVALLLNETSLHDNNKLSARFFALLPNKTAATDRTINHPTDTRATNFRHQTVPIIINLTVEMLPLQDRIMELDHIHAQMSANFNNQRRPQNTATPLRRNTSTNATNIVCNNCGRIGHYARQCPTANRSQNKNRNGNHPQTTANNVNAAPQNQHAYFATNASPSTTSATHYHLAFRASSENAVYNNGTPTIWPDTYLPQMENNQSLLDQDFAPTTSHAPPNSDATEFFPDDPASAYQQFAPPDLDNWLPNSDATSYFTPVFSNLRDVESCHVPVSLADGTTKISTFKCTTDCYFTTTEGQKSILGLGVDVYYIDGLSHRLLSLTAISATENFKIIIQNRATTIRLSKNSTYTWPTILNELPSEQAFSMIAQPNTDLDDDTSISPAVTFEQHLDTSTTPDSPQSMAALLLEITSRCLAHRNFRNLMTGSLHNV
jgi:hypothetical protein